MTLRSMWDDSVAMIGKGLALSRGAAQVRLQGGSISWGETPVWRRLVLGKMGALTETKKSRGWLVGLALVALALVVSLVLA